MTNDSGVSGWVILDKPSGISSAHAVAKVKRLLKPKKIGHAGTLDPLASGVLPLALGEATKTVTYMMDTTKAYGFTVTWGDERDTDDCEGDSINQADIRPSEAEIKAILPEFIGVIQQMPPTYSAIQVDGRRAYEMARAGKDITLKSREIRVDRLELVRSYGQPIDKSEFVCVCGKGTYIRSLARDMGRRLGCYGHISQLRRLQVGNYTEKHAISLENLAEMMHKGDLSFLRSVESALDDILALDVTSTQATQLQRGQAILLPADIQVGNSADTKVLVKCEGKPVAMCEASHGTIKPIRVFNL